MNKLMIQDKFPSRIFDYNEEKYIKPSKHRFLFHHIPKTAGSTFRGILQNLFEPEELCRAEIPKELQAEFESGFNDYRLFGGHFSYGAISKYLEDAVWVTFLRNPIERVVSHYYNHSNIERIPNDWKKRLDEMPEWKQYIDDVQGVSLVEWINHENQTVNSIACNRQTQAFLPDRIRVHVKDWGVYNSEYIELAKKNLREHFSFVGIQEFFDLSLDLFSMTFALNPIDASSYTTNLNSKKTMEKKYDLDLTTLELVQEKNRMDIELYEYGTSLLFERLHIINRKVITNNRIHTMNMLNSENELPETKMDISQLYATHGFYALEGTVEKPFKWSGYNTPSIVEFLWAFQNKKRYTIHLQLLAVISEDILGSLEIHLDNQKLPIKIKHHGNEIIVSSTIDTFDEVFNGVFHSLKIHSELVLEGEQKGARRLGVALNAIELKTL
jgi:sulfotransferase famil protein